MSNILINENNKPSFGINNKLKSQKLIIKKVDSNDKIGMLNGINNEARKKMKII